MIEQTLNSLNEVFNLKGVRRGLWAVILLLVVSIVFESRTQFLSTQSIAARVDVLSKLSDVPGNPGADLVIEQLKISLLDELTEIQEKRDNPTATLVDIFFRFLAGSWIVLLVFPFLLKIYQKAFNSMRKDIEGQKQLEWLMFFGMRGVSVVVWLGTFLGLVSVLWNVSDNFIVTWVLFPACSLFVLLAIALWAGLMKALLPYEQNK